MRLYRGVSAGVVSGAVLLLSAGSALAQGEVGGSVEATTEGAEAEATAEEAPATPPAEEEAPAEEPAPIEPAAEEPPEDDLGFSYLFFGDAYASVQTAQVGTAVPSWRAYEANGVDPVAGRLNENGFGLAFAGLDLSYAGKNWGATTSLRFGPGVQKFYGSDTNLLGIDNIIQAYVTWKPADALTFDFGQFGTIFGAEVSESWLNLNYTRGALYYQMQPFWHTGLRANLALSDVVSLNALLVNDVNQTTLAAPGAGSNTQAALQLAIATDTIGFYLGTLQTLGTGSRLGFDRFFDTVFTVSSGNFSLIFNGDLNISDAADPFGGATFYGLSLAAGYAFTPAFGLAGRVEYLDLDADASDTELLTGTVTLDFKPVKDVSNVVLRWDNKIEAATAPSAAGPFFDGGGGPTNLWYTSTIGLVVYADGKF